MDNRLRNKKQHSVKIKFLFFFNDWLLNKNIEMNSFQIGSFCIYAENWYIRA